MILLCWRRKYTSELDKRRLAKAIGRIIPILLELRKTMKEVSKNIEVNSQLILKQGAAAKPRERNKTTARARDPEVPCNSILTNGASGVKSSGGKKCQIINTGYFNRFLSSIEELS